MTEKKQFVANVIGSIQMDVDQFMTNLAKDELYEKLIHTWILQFYKKGKSIESTVLYIHNQKMQLLQRSLQEFDAQKEKTFQNHQRVMEGIKQHTTYTDLGQKQQLIVQEKIDAMVSTNLYAHHEIIAFILGFIEVDRPDSALAQQTN